MKSFSFGQKFCCFSVVALFFTLANYTLTVHRENVRLEGVIELEEMRSDVNNDFVAELLWARFNDFDYKTDDMLIAQGRIEGVIDYINNDNATYIDNLWHEGYQRGLSQVDYEREVIAENSFERGYEKGKKEQFFVSDESIVNTSPRVVDEDAIKKPEFDVNVNLPETQKQVEELNKKAEELLKSVEE